MSSIRFSLSAIFLTTVLAISGMGCYSEGVVLAPNAAFDASVTTGVTPLDVQFTDRSDGRGRAIISRLWNFGDGQTSSAVNPSHQYTNPGTYSVTLTISTSAGFDTEIKSNFITVTAPAVAPTANFAASTTSGSAPFTVSFTDTSIAGSEAITSRTWDFGDGGSSIEQNPSHTYTEPGVYTVSLTVTTSAGANTETKDGFITVNANTWSRLLRSPYASGEGSLVDVTTSSDGGMVAVGFGPWSNTDSGAWIIKLDSDGNEEWSRRNGGSNESIYLAVTNTLDGGYAATGAYASSWDSSELWVVKYSSEGIRLWEYTLDYNNNGLFNLGTGIDGTADGGVIVSGTVSYGPNDLDGWVMKLSANGDPEWSNSWGDWGDEGATAVRQLTNGNYLVLSSNEFARAEARLYNVSGSLLNVRDLGIDAYAWEERGSIALSQGYAIFATIEGGIARVNENLTGRVEVVSTLPRAIWSRIHSTPDNGFILSGMSEFELPILVKATSALTTDWINTYPTGAFLYSVVPTSGGYYAVGLSFSGEPWAMRTDLNGDAPSVPAQ